MEEIIVNLYLFWGTWQDIKERKIGNIYLAVGAVGGLAFCILEILMGDFSFKKRMMAWIPAVIFLFLAKLWKEKIGFGDGLLLWVLGNYFSIGELWFLLRITFVLLLIFSILLLSSKKAFKECQIPFLPFLWTAHTLWWGLQHG